MPRQVVFRPQAEDEALEVRQWYEAKRPGLGQEFGQQLDILVARIAENPLAFPRVHSETRRAVLRRFPYAVYFRAAPKQSSCWRFTATSLSLAASVVIVLPNRTRGLTRVAPDGGRCDHEPPLVNAIRWVDVVQERFRK